MNKFILTFLLCFLGARVLLAQSDTGNIQGAVTDEQDNPIPGLNAALKGTTLGSITDLNGQFVIEGVPSGSHQLVVSGVGYQSKSRKVTVSEGGSTTADFSLRESLVELQEVEITGRKETTYQNEVSFLATKTATPLQDVPQAVSYVTKEIIQDQQAYRTADVVKNISGDNQFSYYDDFTPRGFRIASG